MSFESTLTYGQIISAIFVVGIILSLIAIWMKLRDNKDVLENYIQLNNSGGYTNE